MIKRNKMDIYKLNLSKNILVSLPDGYIIVKIISTDELFSCTLSDFENANDDDLLAIFDIVPNKNETGHTINILHTYTDDIVGNPKGLKKGIEKKFLQTIPMTIIK
jgi:hypothetical protein